MPGPRYLRRLTFAFLTRFKSLLFLGILAGVVIFLVSLKIVPGFGRSTTLRVGMVGVYYTSDLPFSLLNLIGDGLTKVDDNGEVKPNLAKSWESEDGGKTWKFTIADNKFWQDGTKVDSNTIKYSFEDVSISRPDSKTIIFKLKDSFAPFPTVVSKPTFKKGLLGTGAWKVGRVGLSGDMIDELDLADSDSNKRIYKFFPTEEKAKIAYKLGEIDRIEDLASLVPFDKWSQTVKVEERSNQHRLVGVFFNTGDQLLLAEKKMRQALSYAINKNSLGSERAISPIYPQSWAYNPQTKPYDYDPQRSKELITSIGLSKDQLANLNIKLATTPLLLDVADKIAQDWKAVGVTTTVQVTTTIPEDYQAYLAMYDMPSDPDEYMTWHSTQAETNITNYKNARVDKLLEEGRQEFDIQKRKAIYYDFQRFLLEDAPVAILYFPSTYTISRK